jgi:pimeloyl-ACP methyl ester carboxylesterase
LSVSSVPSFAAERPSLEFHLTYDRKIGVESFTGRVYIILDSPDAEDLPEEIDWFRPQPVLAVDVKNWKPGETVVIAKSALAQPPFSKIEAKQYSIHAVMDLDKGAASFTRADGNCYCKPIVRKVDPNAGDAIKVVIDQVYKEKPVAESETIKLVEIRSKLLSDFHGKPVSLRASVSLPKSFQQRTKDQYPVVYDIPGFGGDHRAITYATHSWTEVDGVEFIHVVLDPNCRTGHHLFVDSETNGPYGKALIEELIPHIEKQYRGQGAGASRFLMGHSSGGWTSLWLQVTYADFFGGCWATAPDEVDFRDFQRTNIYEKGANLFVDEAGKPRPMARDIGKGPIYNKAFSDVETVIGHGGQLGSYEANFSPRSSDGIPRLLWDRKTGKIDPEIAKHWEKYDIRLVLEGNWDKISSKLKGKLHVYVGSKDTFFLEEAVGMLKESQKKLKSDAVIDIIPDKNHATLMNDDMHKRIKEEMVKKYRQDK